MQRAPLYSISMIAAMNVLLLKAKINICLCSTWYVILLNACIACILHVRGLEPDLF